MKPAIAIFVKTPGHSPIKTRLAAHLGRLLAEEWHRLAADCVEQVACSSGLPVYWAVAEREAAADPLWSSLPALVQPEGSLGRRMQSVHDRLVTAHGAAILVGADLPQLRTLDLERSRLWLEHEEPRRILGPAHDGGFWLFGSNQSHPLEAWEAVTYSRHDTASQFIHALDGHAPAAWEFLPRRTDLDEYQDLPAVLEELHAVPDPTPTQRRLAEWLRECIERAA